MIGFDQYKTSNKYYGSGSPQMSIHWGQRYKDTRRKFEMIKENLNRSRTGTIDYLVKYFIHHEEQRNRTPMF